MARTDEHLDAMLRHLGAAYYESLHNRASRADVVRALDTVEERLNERPGAAQEGTAPRPGLAPRARGWTHRVRDVMTTSVITVDRLTPYKEIAGLLAQHKISGVPVLSMGRHVVGVVTEGDLLGEEGETARKRRARPGRGWRRRPQHKALTAGQLMSTPAITIHPGSTIPGAARIMNAHHLRRLPVVDDDGRLLGIVSRRDLLGVFLRPDAEIAEEVRRIFDDLLHADSAGVTVDNGVVTVGGPRVAGNDLASIAIRLTWGVDGVIDVIDRRGLPGGDVGPSGMSRPVAPGASAGEER